MTQDLFTTVIEAEVAEAEVAVVTLGIVLGCIGTCQGWRQASRDQDIVSFRKSGLFRLGIGLVSLAFLTLTLAMPAITSPRDPFDLYLHMPMGFIVAAAFFYMAGPQEARIDLKTRTCYATTGFPFFPKRAVYPLTDAFVAVTPPNESCTQLFLQINQPARHRLQLGTFAKKQDALNYAQKVAADLSIPVQEVPK